MLVPVSGMCKWGLNCWFMKSNIPCKSPPCSFAVCLLQKEFPCSWHAAQRIFRRSPKRESRVPSTCPRRCVGNDRRHLSAAVRSQWPLQLSEAFAGLYWSYLFGWTMTSVKWWRFWLRQHLREQGWNRGRGSPIKCLVGFTLNRYKKISQFRHLPMRTLTRKNTKKNVSLAVTRIYATFLKI